jgi:hypothetical protein
MACWWRQDTIAMRALSSIFERDHYRERAKA